ncbi:LURP1-like domain-containing protein [Cynara cardunculus var. scolymus]|uniref:LURP1-like domain-containing protein n=1 Tax=Cynara cardunculus var. scolymus TaxID=59895 RepID=A0A103YLC4_CYNCS|nr:LURP1-like domain-containing protein [Cynara cardunculus var. scolymus]
MSKIHPSENQSGSCRLLCDHNHVDRATSKHATLTVWKRSSMNFQGSDGFTVYDHHGSLAFRVDNYSRNSHFIRNGWSCSSLAANCGSSGSGSPSGGALVLMDGSGRPLITLKPQIFSIQSQWNGCIYREDDNGSSKFDRRIFTMKKPPSSVLTLGRTYNQQAQCEAEVFFTRKQPEYRIEGSFWNRNCKIRSTGNGEVAAKITRKRTNTIMLNEEVFSLVVKPGFDPQLIMSFVVTFVGCECDMMLAFSF